MTIKNEADLILPTLPRVESFYDLEAGFLLVNKLFTSAKVGIVGDELWIFIDSEVVLITKLDTLKGDVAPFYG